MNKIEISKIGYNPDLILLSRFGFRRCGTSLFTERYVSKSVNNDEEHFLNDLGFATTRDGAKLYVTIASSHG